MSIITNLAKDGQSTADNLNPEQSVIPILKRTQHSINCVFQRATYLRSPNDSFILGHPTLGRLRTDLNFEADCSNNGNHGTWNGTGIDGQQYGANITDDIAGFWSMDNIFTRNVPDESNNSNDGTFYITASAYWPFNGDAEDASTSGKDLTLTGGEYVTDHLGNPTNALRMNGTSDYGEIADIGDDLDDDFTISIWMKPSSQTSQHRIIEKGGNDDWKLMYDAGGDIRFSSGDGTGNKLYTPIDNNVWTHILIAYNGTTMYMYKNGVLVDSDTHATFGTASTKITLGNYGGTKSLGFDGDISEVFLWSQALPIADIVNYYDITSRHKLDKPVVTDGGHTGYEFPSNSTGNTIGYYGTEIDVTANPITLSGPFTVAGWFKVSHFGGYPHIVSNATARGYIRWQSTGASFYCETDTNGQIFQLTYAFSTDTWYHVIIDRDANDDFHLYVNNVLRDTDDARTATDDLTIDYIGGQRNFAGIMSGLQLFNRELTTAEKTSLYNSTNSKYPMISGYRLSAGEFNGTDNYIQVPHSSSLNVGAGDLSICLCVHTLDDSNYQYMLYKRSGTDLVYVRFNDDGTLRFAVNDGSILSAVNTTISFADGLWHAIVCQRDYGSTITISVYDSDGNLEESASEDDNSGDCTNGADIFIGTNYTGSGFDFTGFLDEIMLFDSLITAADITLYINKDYFDSSNAFKFSSDPVGYWSMDNPRLGDRRTEWVQQDGDAIPNITLP